MSSKELFIENYNYSPTSHYFSPGRVNLIGEYTDIASGSVLPLAIQLGIDAHVANRNDRVIRVFSLGEEQKFDLDDLSKSDCSWLNYIKGVFFVFEKHGIRLENGLDIAMESTLPLASGLSSSACLEVLIATIINEEAKANIDKLTIVKYSKEAENDYIGVASGIMDQFAVAFGEKDRCIKLNTATLEYSLAKFELGDNDLVIMNSNKKRTLADSKYNLRVQEVNAGLDDLRKYIDFPYACAISLDDLYKYQDKIKNPDSFKRLKHLITDNMRVKKSSELLEKGDIDGFAKLLVEGHRSMQYDFEASGKELDTLVDLALKYGAKGARMTGAGFGGCAIFISEKSKTQYIRENVAKDYENIIGLHLDTYIATPSKGTCKI